jgi:hypothetical protein
MQINKCKMALMPYLTFKFFVPCCDLSNKQPFGISVGNLEIYRFNIYELYIESIGLPVLPWGI